MLHNRAATCIVMAGITSVLLTQHNYAMMLGEKKTWECVYSKPLLHQGLNAVRFNRDKGCCCKKGSFEVFHEEDGPRCHRRLTYVGILQDKEKSSEIIDQKYNKITAYTDWNACGYVWAYENGKVKVSMCKKVLEDGKSDVQEFDAFPATDITPAKSVIALQFSSQGTYLATLAPGMIKVWKHTKERKNTRREQIPSIVQIPLKQKESDNSCCVIL